MPDTDAELLPMNDVLAVADQRPVGYESIGRSAMRHPLLVALITVLGLVTGSAVGYLHPITYTAQVQLLVGRANGLVEDEVPGLAVAVQGLAADYARLVNTTPVTSDANSLLHTTKLPGSLSASPVPESSIIDVDGQASTEAGAVSLANAGGAALVKVVTADSNDTQQQLNTLRNAYKSAEKVAQSDTAQANLLQTQLNALAGSIGSTAPTPAQVSAEQSLTNQIAAKQTAASTEELTAQAYQNQYNQAVPPLSVQQEMVQQVGNATYTGSNQRSYLEASGLVGFVGGLVIGLALAAFIDMRRFRMYVRRPHELATPEL